MFYTKKEYRRKCDVFNGHHTETPTSFQSLQV